MNFSVKNNSSTVDFSCNDIYLFYQRYISLTISILNIIFNSLNVAIIIKLVGKGSKKSEFFCFLLIKSITDAFIGFRFILRDIIEKILFYPNSLKSTSFFIILIYIIITKYLSWSVILISRISECCASFNRLIDLLISFKKLNKYLIRIAYIALVIFSFIFYIYRFFEYQVVRLKTADNSTNVIQYGFVRIKHSYLLDVIDLIHSLIKDIIFVSASVVINFITFLLVRKSYKKKLRLTKQNKQLKSISLRQRSDIRTLIMITTTSSIAFIGHLGSFLQNLPIEPNVFEDKCLLTVGEIFYEMTFCVNFIVYVIFNKRFCDILFARLRLIKKNSKDLTTSL